MTPLISLIIVLTISIAIIFGNYKLIKKWSKILKSTLGKIGKISIVTISSLIILILLITAGILINDIWENRLRKYDEFEGIKLGWVRDEVIFRIGNPTEIQKRPNDKQLEIYPNLAIHYQASKVNAIERVCDTNNYNKINGLACGDNVDKILKILGQPKALDTFTDKISRLYCYANYNVCFEATLGKISSIYIGDMSDGKTPRYFTPEQQKDIEALNTPPKKLVPPEDLPDNLKPKIVKKEKKSFNPDEYLKENTDHCAPNISRDERLKRLSLKGNVRQTGANSYNAGSSYVQFSYTGDLISCY